MAKPKRSRAPAMGRLFECPTPTFDPARYTIFSEIASRPDAHSALCHAAMVCIREAQPVLVESRVRKLAGGIFASIAETERTPFDTAYLATLSYDQTLMETALRQLDKLRISLEEATEPDRATVMQLYSCSILLTQSSPVIKHLDVLSNIALLRARCVVDGEVNAFEALKNLAIELHSDDGAIGQAKFYESLHYVFSDIAADYKWDEGTGATRMSSRDFACLVKQTMKSKDVSSMGAISEALPSQLVLDI